MKKPPKKVYASTPLKLKVVALKFKIKRLFKWLMQKD